VKEAVRAIGWVLVLALMRADAAAQPRPDGYVSVTLAGLPGVAPEAVELRARIFAEQKVRPREWLTLQGAGFVEGLVRGRSGLHRDAIVRPLELYAEFANERADVRVGYSRIVWGRLDEIQPTDVVNPLDLARYFFEGRAEARIAVPLARGRVFFGERATLEGVLVPLARRDRFDRLDEESSPFNLLSERVVCLAIGVCPPLVVPLEDPPATWKNVQGGGRLSATAGRVDLSVVAYRKTETRYQLPPGGGQPPGAGGQLPAGIVAEPGFSRVTMVGGDVETARGAWAFRAEGAAFLGDSDRFQAGAGFDRRAGDFHLSGTLIVTRDEPLFGGAARTTTSVVAGAERTFARERYRTRGFAVYNLDDRAAFLRNITSAELATNLVLELSGGWFIGDGTDIIGLFADRDFLYARLRLHF